MSVTWSGCARLRPRHRLRSRSRSRARRAGGPESDAELLPNGRYDEARGTRESAYAGRYEVHADRIGYVDDTVSSPTGASTAMAFITAATSSTARAAQHTVRPGTESPSSALRPVEHRIPASKGASR